MSGRAGEAQSSPRMAFWAPAPLGAQWLRSTSAFCWESYLTYRLAAMTMIRYLRQRKDRHGDL